MQRVKDNPINNRLIQLYIKIFPKIEEIFYDEILVLKKSLFLKRPFSLKIIACHTLWKHLLLSWLDISLLSFQACLKWSLPHPHPRRLPWSSSRLKHPPARQGPPPYCIPCSIESAQGVQQLLLKWTWPGFQVCGTASSPFAFEIQLVFSLILP